MGASPQLEWWNNGKVEEWKSGIMGFGIQLSGLA